jgi:glycyl-tRNA synthetase beta chain
MTANEQGRSTGNPVDGEDLLIEIGCEELPPKALDGLRDALFSSITTGLTKENIAFDSANSKAYSTPRRLAVLLKSVASGQADQDQERRGPALSAAFDADGQPTPAALGFARSVGKDVNELDRLESDKGSWLITRIQVPGKPLEDLVFPLLEQAIRQLPVPRPMRWADHDFSFVRPVHWLVVLYGNRILPGEFLGQTASNTTRGHRVHSPGPHNLVQASDYLSVLELGFVLADQEVRKSRIEGQLLEINPACRIEPDLLAEVCNLVEWPIAIGCSFDPEFLAVPHEALVASMQDHQRFFPVDSAVGSKQLSNQFIAVANLESTDEDQVRKGFERVIRPRLADAQFFLEQDQKQSLDSYFDGLGSVVFQNKIGSVGDKSKRIQSISKIIAEDLNSDVNECSRAARLCKCDLLTLMVGEFPELQGTMGQHYALHSGETKRVADAIRQHYLPRYAGDLIPGNEPGQIVGLADRADTLVAIFTAGMKPTGNKDPFALRRCALGLIRILLEANLDLPVDYLLSLAATELSNQGVEVDPSIPVEVLHFIGERARNYFRDAGHDTEVVNAALGANWKTLPDLRARLDALSAFLGQDSGKSLAAANKRIGNILRKANIEKYETILKDRLILDEEASLFEEVISMEESLIPLLQGSDYQASLDQLAKLRPGVDAFFDAVMVMDEDLELRNNRLALLARLKGLFDQIADLSVLG